MIPDRILNYKINRLIGEGGMAKVYEADLDSKLGTKVAVKVLDRHLATEESLKERFRQEAKSMTQLKHPNIVNVLNFVEEKDTLAIVMEYIEGQSLKELVEENGPIAPDLAIEIFSGILDAMQYVHDKGMIHRDIKPSNIFIIEGKYPKILDFGIVKVLGGEGHNKTKTGLTIGTPMYMSPEQIQTPQNIDFRTDIYSLGVTLHYMLAGNPPYDPTGSEFIIQSKVVQESLPVLSGVPENIFDAISCATEKDRDNRFRNCIDFKRVLSSGKGINHQNATNKKDPVFKATAVDEPNKEAGNKEQLKPKLPQPDNASENSSGNGLASVIPPEIDNWNWGAFFLNWIWGIGNSAFIALLCLIPFVNIVMIFIVGANGNKWAWRNKRWDSIEHFKSVQKKWTQWGVGLFLVNSIIIVILIIASINASNSSYDSYDDYSTAEEESFGVDESNGVSIQQVNGLYAVAIPDFMKKINGLNDDADLEYGNVYKELYVIVIDEEKSEVEEYINIYDFTEYTELIFEGIEYNVDNASLSQTQYLNINGYDARLKEITGSVDGISIFYLIGIIEGQDHYYQVFTWTVKEEKYSHMEKMYDIVKSFKEL